MSLTTSIKRNKKEYFVLTPPTPKWFPNIWKAPYTNLLFLCILPTLSGFFVLPTVSVLPILSVYLFYSSYSFPPFYPFYLAYWFVNPLSFFIRVILLLGQPIINCVWSDDYTYIKNYTVWNCIAFLYQALFCNHQVSFFLLTRSRQTVKSSRSLNSGWWWHN